MTSSTFPQFRFKLNFPSPKWTAVQDPPNPDAPFRGSVKLSHSEYDPDPAFGTAPIISLTCEDVTAAGASLHETANLIKKNSIDQFNTMTRSQFPPKVTVDSKKLDPAVVGAHFTRHVEITLDCPGHPQLLVVMYFAMKNGVVYAFQFLSTTEIVEKHREEFTSMVRDVEFINVQNESCDEELDNLHLSRFYVVASSPIIVGENNVMMNINIPTFWSTPANQDWSSGSPQQQQQRFLKVPTSICPASTVMASFKTNSGNAPEHVVIVNAEPQIAEGSTRGFGIAFKFLESAATTQKKNDAAILMKTFSAFTGSPDNMTIVVRVAKHPFVENVWLVACGQESPVQTRDGVLLNVLKSYKTVPLLQLQEEDSSSSTNTTPPPPTTTTSSSPSPLSSVSKLLLRSDTFGFQCNLNERSKISQQSSIFPGMLKYEPILPKQDAFNTNESLPSVIIRCQTSQQQQQTLAECEKFVREQPGVDGVKCEIINGLIFLTYYLREFIDHPLEGYEDDVTTKTFIFVNSAKGHHHSISWTVATGDWEKFEEAMLQFVGTFKFDDVVASNVVVEGEGETQKTA